MSVKTIIFTGQEQVELITEPLPKPGPGQVLVETTRTLISTGTESICYRRNFSPGTHWDRWVKYPFRTGYLNAGRIIELGEGVTNYKVGERVASRASHTSHSMHKVEVPAANTSPEKGDCTPSSSIVRIPEGVSDEEACWMGLGKITQVGVRAAEHKMGDVVVVVGLGLLGQLVTQYTRLLGASEVIAIDTSAKRLEFASMHGATATLKMTAAEALDHVKKLSNGAGADVVYEITGHPAVFATALPLARRFGTLCLLGDAGSPHLQTLTPDIVTRGVKIVGAHDGHPPASHNDFVRWGGPQIYELFMKYLSRKQLRLSDLITSRFKPEQCKEAYTLLQTNRENEMGVVFEWK